MVSRFVFIVHKDYTQGKDSIIGAYDDEELAKEAYRACEQIRTDSTTFSLVAVKVFERTVQDPEP